MKEIRNQQASGLGYANCFETRISNAKLHFATNFESNLQPQASSRGQRKKAQNRKTCDHCSQGELKREGNYHAHESHGAHRRLLAAVRVWEFKGQLRDHPITCAGRLFHAGTVLSEVSADGLSWSFSFYRLSAMTPRAASQHAPYRGRLAPSPTGYLHVGHAATFWRAQNRCRARSARWSCGSKISIARAPGRNFQPRCSRT